MLRRLYRCAVHWHPSSFRGRFGDEMLYIFDQQKGTLAELRVTLDCVFSLLKQWTLRPHVGIDEPAAPPQSPTSGHIPSFETLESFQPRASAIIHSTVLSLILFYMTVFGIRYSWIHILNLRIPEIAANPTQPPSRDSKRSEHLQVDVIPTEPEGDQTRTRASTSPGSLVPPVPPRRLIIWLDLYVGKYISNHPPVKISIQIEGDHLSLTAPGQRFSLTPVSRTRFVVVGVKSSYVDFTADVKGGICCLSWVVNGNVITAER